MSAELLAEWTERVKEMEAQVRLAQKDVDLVTSSLQREKREMRKFLSKKDAERQELLVELEEVEQVPRQLQATMNAVREEETEVQEAYHRALDAYEALHFAVRDISELQEEKLTRRIHYEKVFEVESAEWAEEERQLRQQLHEAQQRAAAAHKSRAAERAALEATLKQVTAQLELDRDRRRHEQEEYVALTSRAPLARLQAVGGPSRKKTPRLSIARVCEVRGAAGVDGDGAAEEDEEGLRRHTDPHRLQQPRGLPTASASTAGPMKGSAGAYAPVKTHVGGSLLPAQRRSACSMPLFPSCSEGKEEVEPRRSTVAAAPLKSCFKGASAPIGTGGSSSYRAQTYDPLLADGEDGRGKDAEATRKRRGVLEESTNRASYTTGF
eukprot:gene1393-816_t